MIIHFFKNLIVYNLKFSTTSPFLQNGQTDNLKITKNNYYFVSLVLKSTRA